MEREELLRRCRYYNGEEECPFKPEEGNDIRLLWFYEKRWCEKILSDGEAAFKWDIEEYEAYKAGEGLSSSLPKSLLALLFNRYGKGFYSMAYAAKHFPEFIAEWYSEPERGATRDELIKHCRYV